VERVKGILGEADFEGKSAGLGDAPANPKAEAKEEEKGALPL
jgi:hypothetical protein